MFKTAAFMLASLIPLLAHADDKPKDPKRLKATFIDLKPGLVQADAALRKARQAEAIAKEQFFQQRQQAEKSRLVAENEQARAEEALSQARAAIVAEMQARKQAEAAHQAAVVALQTARGEQSQTQPRKRGRKDRRQNNNTAELAKQVQMLAKQVQKLQMEVHALKAMIQKAQAGKLIGGKEDFQSLKRQIEQHTKAAEQARRQANRALIENEQARQLAARKRAEDALRGAEAARRVLEARQKAAAAEARYVFDALDRAKDGKLSTEEWFASQTVREGFIKAGIELKTPADFKSFLNQYPPYRLVPRLRLPDGN